MHEILDENGTVKSWLDSGRGVRLWRSREIGVWGEIHTPGDVTEAPSWRYVAGDELLDHKDIRLFVKSGVYYDGKRHYEWSDTPAGWKAAEMAIDKLPLDNAGAPCRMLYRYTIERITYRTEETRDDGKPLGLHFRCAIIQWTAKGDGDA